MNQKTDNHSFGWMCVMEISLANVLFLTKMKKEKSNGLQDMDVVLRSDTFLQNLIISWKKSFWFKKFSVYFKLELNHLQILSQEIECQFVALLPPSLPCLR